MSKPFAYSAKVIASLAILPSAFAASPIDRLLGGSDNFDPSPYSEADLDEQKQFAPESDGDSDLGDQFILKRNSAKRTPIRARLETGAFWVDNVRSANTDEQDDWFWATRAELSWRPRLSNGLFLDTYLREDIYRYDRSGLDFESTEIGLGIVKVFPEFGDLVTFARYEFEHINAGSPGGSSDTSNHFHRIHLGANRNFVNLPEHTAYAALDASFDLDTDPAYTEREELALHLGYTWHPTDKIATTFFYRAAFIDYQNVDRGDLFQTTGVELAYTISDAVKIKTSFVYGNNDSDTPLGANDYETMQAGLLGSLVVKW